MAAPIKFLRCCRFKSFYNLQQTRTHIGVPKSLYPTVDSHRRPHKLDHDEYFGDAPVATKSWAKIQEELHPVDEEVSAPINIGERWKGQSRKPWQDARNAAIKSNKENFQLERTTRLEEHIVSLDDVEDIYRVESLPADITASAKHYGIFEHLFKGAYFIPVTQLDVCFDCGDDDEHVVPVLRGNEIAPAQAKAAPHVSFAAEPDALYTLLLTNPDGHLMDNNAEYLHWMISNIKEGDIDTGDLLCDYLPPFPPRGTGWHRHVFVLFKQTKQLDLSEHQRPSNCTCLKQRTFSTYDFLRKHEDDLTAVGLSFFQAEWDPSVKHTFHHVLNMREPSFEYAHPQEYRAPQKRYPHLMPFDRYMDKYRDKKDLAEEAIRLRLSQMENPLEPPPSKDKYARAYWHDYRSKPTWLQRKEQLAARRVEYFKDVDV